MHVSTCFVAWMYLYPRWPSRSSNWKCLLGVVLLGAWNSAWWPDAERQDYRWRRRFVQYVFQRDWSGKTRSPCRVRWLGADCCWWVKTNQFKALQSPCSPMLTSRRSRGPKWIDLPFQCSNLILLKGEDILIRRIRCAKKCKCPTFSEPNSDAFYKGEDFLSRVSSHETLPLNYNMNTLFLVVYIILGYHRVILLDPWNRE